MKLHRIEVTNINSLYGDQVVDLDGALAGASLFLIQGPTGSGKSTLMDAISLALFVSLLEVVVALPAHVAAALGHRRRAGTPRRDWFAPVRRGFTAGMERLLRDIHQTLGLGAASTDGHRSGVVPDVAVVADPHINAHNVAELQFP